MFFVVRHGVVLSGRQTLVFVLAPIEELTQSVSVDGLDLLAHRTLDQLRVFRAGHATSRLASHFLFPETVVVRLISGWPLTGSTRCAETTCVEMIFLLQW